MTRYMVLVRGVQPEYIEAEKYTISDRAILEFWVGDQRTAAFIEWLGVKQTISPISAMMTSTTTNPTRANISAHFSSHREPLV